MKHRSVAWAVWAGGFIAGTLDIVFAIAFASWRGIEPVTLLQTVASGLLGQRAFSGGTHFAALGLAAHYGMSFVWAGLFVLAARKFPMLTRQPVWSGLLLGIVVFLAMRLVVLPLSAFPYPVSFKPLATTLDLLSHLFLFGIPIALAARAADAPQERA